MRFEQETVVFSRSQDYLLLEIGNVRHEGPVEFGCMLGTYARVYDFKTLRVRGKLPTLTYHLMFPAWNAVWASWPTINIRCLRRPEVLKSHAFDQTPGQGGTSMSKDVSTRSGIK